MAALEGADKASSSLSICFLLTIGVPLVVRNPLSFQMTEWVCAIKKAYLESVYMFTVFPLDRRRALVSAISSACCDVVPCGKGLASRTAEDVTTVYPAYLFPREFIKELPSTNRVNCEPSNGWSCKCK